MSLIKAVARGKCDLAIPMVSRELGYAKKVDILNKVGTGGYMCDKKVGTPKASTDAGS